MEQKVFAYSQWLSYFLLICSQSLQLPFIDPIFFFHSEIFWKLSNFYFALPPVFWHLQILNEFLYRKWTFLSDWMHFSEVLVLALALKLPMIPGGTNLEPLEKIQLGFLKEYHFVNREKIVLPISYFITLCKYFLQPKSDESRNQPTTPTPSEMLLYSLVFMGLFTFFLAYFGNKLLAQIFFSSQ